MDSVNRPRRHIIRATVAVAGSALVLTAGARLHANVPSVPSDSDDNKPESKGYHETEHILHYYNTARF